MAYFNSVVERAAAERRKRLSDDDLHTIETEAGAVAEANQQLAVIKDDIKAAILCSIAYEMCNQPTQDQTDQVQEDAITKLLLEYTDVIDNSLAFAISAACNIITADIQKKNCDTKVR
jgi:hypothetical protein